MITLPLETMSTEEKIQVMEDIWNSFTSPKEFISPQWHENILKDRENENSFVAWKDAKKEILNKLV